MNKKVFENPLIKDRVTVLESAEETGGDYLLLQVELEAGGGNAWHYHTSFAEEFTAVEGTLGIGVNKKQVLLKPGQKAVAHIGQVHRFYNPGREKILFHVKLVPGNTGFLQTLGIAYGLAADGLTNKKGIPKKLDHLACVWELSDTRLTGFLSLITPFLLRRAKRARKKGIQKMLLEKYCQ